MWNWNPFLTTHYMHRKEKYLSSVGGKSNSILWLWKTLKRRINVRIQFAWHSQWQVDMGTLLYCQKDNGLGIRYVRARIINCIKWPQVFMRFNEVGSCAIFVFDDFLQRRFLSFTISFSCPSMPFKFTPIHVNMFSLILMDSTVYSECGHNNLLAPWRVVQRIPKYRPCFASHCRRMDIQTDSKRANWVGLALRKEALSGAL